MARCKICRSEFQKRNMAHKVCSPECGLEWAKLERERKEAKQLRERKEAIKSRSDWMKEAQAAFNAWIRWRDRDRPCISCGRFHKGQYHAGHYLSTGARPELRFDEANVWKQCQPCNTHLSGNLILYRAALVNQIGLAEVERLEGPHSPKKYTSEMLREIRDTYRKRLADEKRTIAKHQE